MKFPPAWKVKRELFRLKEKVQDLVLPRFTDRLKQVRHDRNLSHLLRETPGAKPLSPRIAVFVLFQPKGIAGSTFLTLNHLAQEGWSVLVVSNAPLSAPDRQRIAAQCAHVIERPNTGYDFGAYREGWRWLDRRSQKPDRLILMNDSSWFPLQMQDDSLRRMEALDADLAGHILKTEVADDPAHDHLESHLLMFGPGALRDPHIQSFLDSFVMSNDKRRTILQGEKGVTQAAKAAGLRVRALLEKEGLLSQLSELSLDELKAVFQRLALHSVEDRNWRDQLLRRDYKDPEWTEEVLRWAYRSLASSRQILLSAAFVDFAITRCGLGFVKKSSDVRFHLARQAVLRAAAEGRTSFIDPVVMAEIEVSVSSWTLPFDWRAKPDDQQIVKL